MRLFALQATLHTDATLLGMLPQMVRSGWSPRGGGGSALRFTLPC
jgi:hypothetical protein